MPHTLPAPSPRGDAPAIQADGVTKRFGEVTAVDDLTFSVPVGSVTGFLGPNGAGKTTTLRMVLGLARPDSGTTRVLGGPYGSSSHPMHRVGAALEVTGFHPGRSAANHLRVTARMAAIDPGRAGVVLGLTGLTEHADRRVGTFSLGMKQRLALATAMLGEPRVLVLDEPANGLDPAGVAWLRGFLRRHADSGGAVLVSSHILAEVAEVADRVVVIDRGALVTQGSVDLIRSAAGVSVLVRTPAVETLRSALLAAGAELREGAEATQLVVVSMPAARVGQIASDAGVVLHELREVTPTLEDAFLRLTGGSS